MKQTRKLVTHKLSENKLNEEDAELFLEFIREAKIKRNLSDASVNKYTHGVCGILGIIKDLGTNTKELRNGTVLSLIESFKNKDWTPETKSSNWKSFIAFYRWVWKNKGGGDEQAYLHLLDKEEGYRYRIEEGVKRDILTESEFLRLLHAENELCWKVFFACAYEGAMSSVEARTLLLKDVTEREVGYTLNIREGKNKIRKRPVEIIEWGDRYLESWLQVHPFKDDENALLFLNTNNKPITTASANKRLRTLVRALDKTKTITTHNLRHSRLTSIAEFMSEYQLNAVAGWTQGSSMAKRYVHSRSLNVRRKLLTHYGYSEEEQKEREKVGRSCPVCEKKNPITAKRCDACNSPLNAQLFRQEQEKKDTALNEQREALKKYMRELYAEIIEEEAQIRAS